MKVDYSQGIIAGHKSTTTITTSEADLLTVSNVNDISKTQMTIYYDVTLGSATAVTFYYYYSMDNTNWFRIPTKNTSTGVLVDTPTVINSTSPTVGSDIQTFEDVRISAAQFFKVSAKATTASATLNECYIVMRDN